MKWRFSRQSRGLTCAKRGYVVGPAPFSVGKNILAGGARRRRRGRHLYTGKVRNHNTGDSVKALTLERIGMTERKLWRGIVAKARSRWHWGGSR